MILRYMASDLDLHRLHMFQKNEDWLVWINTQHRATVWCEARVHHTK